MAQPIRISIAKIVLKAAGSAGATEVCTACRRVVNAWDLGKKHDREDMRTVLAYYFQMETEG